MHAGDPLLEPMLALALFGVGKDEDEVTQVAPASENVSQQAC